MKELAERPVTLPRLRGEVGIRVLAHGLRVMGTGPLRNGERLYNRGVSYPNPLLASAARANRAAVIQPMPDLFIHAQSGSPGEHSEHRTLDARFREHEEKLGSIFIFLTSRAGMIAALLRTSGSGGRCAMGHFGG